MSKLLTEAEAAADEPFLDTATSIMDLLDSGIDIQMPKQKLQFVRTRGDVVRDEKGSIMRNEDDSTMRTKGHKRGVLIAFIDEDPGKICIGYSLCHRVDRFDYRNGYRIKGLGAWQAIHKAEKYRDCATFIISTLPEHKQVSKDIVKIPQSIVDTLQSFIYRCSRYYKDKQFPQWAVDFALHGKQPELCNDGELPDVAA